MKAQQLSKRFEAVFAPIALPQLVHATNAVHGQVEGPHRRGELAVSLQSTAQHRLKLKRTEVIQQSNSELSVREVHTRPFKTHESLIIIREIKGKASVLT